MVRKQPSDRPQLFKVGIADVVPKSIAYRLLVPAIELAEPVRLLCKENSLDSLLADLALHKLDIVIADGPIPSNVNVRGFNHVLGESGISFLGVSGVTKKLRGTFPHNLNGAPLLLPSEINQVHWRLMHWLDSQNIQPNIVAEFDDSALMKTFGQGGKGIFISPTAIAEEISDQYGVKIVGSTEDVREQYYAISVERRISHPAVVAMTKSARTWLR